MPFMYEAPNGHHTSQAYAESEIELLKLLNGGHPRSDELASEFAPSCGQHLQVVEEDSDDDFTMRRRYPRMSFDGRAYPPVPPDASSLSRPADDDWFTEAETIPPPLSNDSGLARYELENYSGNSTYAQAEVSAAVDMDPYYAFDHYDRFQQQQPIWSPPHAWPAMSAAPVLHPRVVQLPDRPLTPHDTYRYPSIHNDHIYVAPIAPSSEAINHAFATWYCGQVINLLVIPGQYRPGVGGASDVLWGRSGREKDGWERVGRTAPEYSKPWGRMGMASTPVPAPRQAQRRRPELELRDPWHVEWANATQPSPTLVSFVLDLVQRMSITPYALVSALWFLTGLGLHDGDGIKGANLRSFLQEFRSFELEAVEKRVATLGLMLAGKWLDDNSFLIKSWHEVTAIPIKQLDRMERHALEDLHYSLFVPISSWVDHVNKLYASHISKSLPDEVDAIVTPIIDQMVTEARETELCEPTSMASFDIDRRLSVEELPAAADQAISRDWGTFARTYAHIGNGEAYSQEIIDGYPYDLRSMEDEELERAEKSVDALVNEMDEDEGEDEDEEEFLDYDGAKRWLPPLTEGRRSASCSSDRSRSSPIDAHHRAIAHPTTSHNAVPVMDLDLYEIPSRQRHNSYWSRNSHKPTSHACWPSSDTYRKTSSKYQFSPCCQLNKPNSKRDPLSNRSLNAYSDDEDAKYLEPGISVVHPPTAYDMRYESSRMTGSRRDTRLKYQFANENEDDQITNEDYYTDYHAHARPHAQTISSFHHPTVTAAGYY